MLNFMTSKQASEKISGLETRVEELEAELVAKDSTIETLQAEQITATEQITNLTADLATANEKLVKAEATVADQETTITEANAKLGTFNQEVSKGVQLGIANLGFTGESLASSKESSDKKEDFSEMTGIKKAIAAHKAKSSKK